VVTAPAEAGAAFALAVEGDPERFGEGLIHDTWRVTANGARWIVQRINTTVFPDVVALMANVLTVSEHLKSPVRYECTGDGTPWWTSPTGDVWRVSRFLEHTTAAASPAAAGRAFGQFHRRVADLDPDRLTETLPGFHDPARRLADLHNAVGTGRRRHEAVVGAAINEVMTRAHLAVAGAAFTKATACTRVAHFDAKTDNVLFDEATGDPICVADLDTVMPGSWLWDIGDLIRTAACPVAEDDPEPERVVLDSERFTMVTGAWLDEVGTLLTAGERASIPLAGLVITFEQAVRFLTDYVAGDVYYRVEDPEHNLRRFRAQWHLLQSMEAQQSAMIKAL
jgi:hypothetical protein